MAAPRTVANRRAEEINGSGVSARKVRFPYPALFRYAKAGALDMRAGLRLLINLFGGGLEGLSPLQMKSVRPTSPAADSTPVPARAYCFRLWRKFQSAVENRRLKPRQGSLPLRRKHTGRSRRKTSPDGELFHRPAALRYPPVMIPFGWTSTNPAKGGPSSRREGPDHPGAHIPDQNHDSSCRFPQKTDRFAPLSRLRRSGSY